MQGWNADEGEFPEPQFIDVIEVIVAKDKSVEIGDKIIQSLKDKTDLYFKPHYAEHDIDSYSVHEILNFDLKGNEIYCDEESIHYDFWSYMEDNNLGFKITRTFDEV